MGVRVRARESWRDRQGDLGLVRGIDIIAPSQASATTLRKKPRIKQDGDRSLREKDDESSSGSPLSYTRRDDPSPATSD